MYQKKVNLAKAKERSRKKDRIRKKRFAAPPGRGQE